MGYKIGVDSVVISGEALYLPLQTKTRRFGSKEVQVANPRRGAIRLRAVRADGRWRFRFQVSLPRLILGNNFETIPIGFLRPAVAFFLSELKAKFPEFAGVSLDYLAVQRLDFAFDFGTPCTRELLEAMLGCYLGGRNHPGFIFESKRNCGSFYSRDYREKSSKNLYRSLICYPKDQLPNGQPELRVESRLQRQAIGRERIDIASLHIHGEKLLHKAWKHISERFEFLIPTIPEGWHDGIASIRTEGTREILEDVSFFATEVPLDLVANEPIGDRALIKRTLRKLGIGYGNPCLEELSEFARVRDAINRKLSAQYINSGVLYGSDPERIERLLILQPALAFTEDPRNETESPSSSLPHILDRVQDLSEELSGINSQGNRHSNELDHVQPAGTPLNLDDEGDGLAHPSGQFFLAHSGLLPSLPKDLDQRIVLNRTKRPNCFAIHPARLVGITPTNMVVLVRRTEHHARDP